MNLSDFISHFLSTHLIHAIIVESRGVLHCLWDIQNYRHQTINVSTRGCGSKSFRRVSQGRASYKNWTPVVQNSFSSAHRVCSLCYEPSAHEADRLSGHLTYCSLSIGLRFYPWMCRTKGWAYSADRSDWNNSSSILGNIIIAQKLKR